MSISVSVSIFLISFNFSLSGHIEEADSGMLTAGVKLVVTSYDNYLWCFRL